MSSSDLRSDPLASSTIPFEPSPMPPVQHEDDSIVAVSAAAAAALDHLADDLAVERDALTESDTGAGSNHSLSRTTLPTPTLPNLSPRSKEDFPELDKLISGSDTGSGSNLASSVSRSELQASLEAETCQGSNTDLKDAVQLRAAGHVPGYSPSRTPISLSPLNNSPSLPSDVALPTSAPVEPLDDDAGSSASTSSSSLSNSSEDDIDTCCHQKDSSLSESPKTDLKELADPLAPAPLAPAPSTPLPPAPSTPLPPVPEPSTPPRSPVTKKTPVRQITPIIILEGAILTVSVLSLAFFAIGKGAMITYFAGPALFSVPLFGIGALLSATLLAKNYYPLKV